jgi:hypothetical protein
VLSADATEPFQYFERLSDRSATDVQHLGQITVAR